MFETYDTLIILLAKLVLLIGFIYSLKYWFDKSQSIIPVILYWLLGLIFVLLISSTIFDWLIITAINSDEYGALSVIFGIVFYIIVGFKNFKKN
tara:strand:- start:81 stop:362 length:282 start_codon:yes stop_codon:yes gene_type:complete